ncbi:MAG: BrnA antitoxin family protein, partial [Candidatus Adiutrix sp.]|nr:BrnA antitoxin family protein [Candidatus Adiutrix sp.]
TVSVRLSPSYIEKYKTLGKGYTGIMADVLTYVADHPEILTQFTGTEASRAADQSHRLAKNAAD